MPLTSTRPSANGAGAPQRTSPTRRLQLLRLEDRSVPSAAVGDRVYSVNLVPDDPKFADGSLYGLTRIQAPLAWDTTTGSPTVVVAGIDTGIDYTHEDLYLNIWINQREIPVSRRANLADTDGDGLITFRDLNDPVNRGPGKANDVDNNGRIDARDILAPMQRLLIDTGNGGWDDDTDADANGYADDLVGWNFVNNTNRPFDDHGHGTHTAGTIGALGNNGTGVTGVNWAVRIMPLKFLDANGSGTDEAAIAAIRYAADNGARVSNNSWGGYFGAAGDTLYQAIEYAGTKGHLFVAAAGNDGLNNDTSPYRSFPASYDLPNIISVAATDAKDNRPRWSNYGKASVDLGAPGVGIWSTVPGGYVPASGTSMAAPHVTGAAALILAEHPGLSADQVKTLILSTADPVRALRNKVATDGRLNVGRALAAAAGAALPSAGPDMSDPAPGQDDPATLPGLPNIGLFMTDGGSPASGPGGGVAGSHPDAPEPPARPPHPVLSGRVPAARPRPAAQASPPGHSAVPPVVAPAPFLVSDSSADAEDDPWRL